MMIGDEHRLEPADLTGQTRAKQPKLFPPPRHLLLLLLLLIIGESAGILRPANAQRQGESLVSRPSWSPSSARSSRGNSVALQPDEQPQEQYRPSSAERSRGSSQAQQNDAVEYYYYYDYEDGKPGSPVRSSSERKPKVARTEQQQADTASAAYDDSYYYEDDYEEQSEEKSRELGNASAETEEPQPADKSHETKTEQEEQKQASVESDGLGDKKVSFNESEDSILIGEAIVSVVTTKSVVNGTFSVPEVTTPSPATSSMSTSTSTEISPTTGSTTEEAQVSSSTSAEANEDPDTANESSEQDAPARDETSSTTTTTTTTTTTESSIAESSTSSGFVPSSTIQPSVQTGRSVSGARYLPFPSVVDKAEQLDSTESIIDKLDRVQSELSSGFLANGRFVPRRYNKKPFSPTSLTLPTSSTTLAPTSSPIAPLNITAITKRPKLQTTLDDIAAFLPKGYVKNGTSSSTPATLTKRPRFQTTLDDVEAFLPKDFPRSGGYRTTSTKRPKFQTTLDDLDGFLPKDYPKSGYRNSYKNRNSYKTTAAASTTSTTTASPTTADESASTEKSVASTRIKALTTIEDISAFLPPGYKLKKEEASTEKSLLSDILSKTNKVEAKEVTSSTTERAKSIQDLFAKSSVDVSALLPPGYKPEANDSSSKTSKSDDPLQGILAKSSVDISALLPAGYKPAEKKEDDQPSNKSAAVGPVVEDLFSKSNVDISALLPEGFGQSNGNEVAAGPSTGSPGQPSPVKVVFPSRPGGRKPIHKITTPSSNRAAAGGPDAASPKIQKGWPTRATTEFTGWPSSSTTPISIEKLLEAARTATAATGGNSSLPPSSTEPGDGTTTTSAPSTTSTTTLRPTTPGLCDEACEVAGTIRIVDNATWLPELLDRNTREWQDLAEEIEREMNLVFAKSPVLRKWFRNIRIDSFSQGSVLVDYFVELADLKEKINTQQLKVIFHDSIRTFNYDNPMEASPKGPLKLGRFTIEPKSTDFVVIPRITAPKLSQEDDRLIPQWAIAMMVIGVGGLLFTVVFGVSVLVNRQHGSKLKPSISAMYEEEMSKNATMSHASVPVRPPAADYPRHNESQQAMWSDAGWHDKPYESTSHKILVDGLPYERKYNMYDSWKSEWNGYYYPPTQASGSNYSRHHPDYDINF